MKGVFRKGEKVYLAPVELKGLDNYLRWFNDPEVTRYLAMYYPVNSFCEKQYIENSSRAGDQVPFDIFLVDGDRHIGNCAISMIDWVNRRCMFGIAIGERDCWGKGYGTEATELCVKFAFDRMNMHRVALQVFEYNDRGVRAYEKAGFEIEGRLKESRYFEGKYYDTILMSIFNKATGK